MFEKKLKNLFDAQYFFEDASLAAAIHGSAIRLLSDDETELLFAAGDPYAAEGKKDDGGR